LQKFEARIKVIVDRSNSKAIVYNMYYFHPVKKLLYCEVGQFSRMIKVYMDYEETMNQPYTLFETFLFLPDEFDSPNRDVNDIGWYAVGLGGTEVINENNP